MKHNIGIIYASVDGHTKKICEALQQTLSKENLSSELHHIDHLDFNISEYNTIIIGASVRYGKHNKNIINFIQNNAKQLNAINTALFSVNLVARKKEKSSLTTNPYMIKLLESINWKADFMEVFAGKLDYTSYGFFDKLMIKLIMKFTNGPTTTDEPIVYTNWEKVHTFGMKIADHIKTLS
ncbi:MAG: menaquinone-dependent protoporphyrinogen IX dehydrogenase [Winogradskyella sp.]